MGVTVAEIKKRLSEADAEEFAVLERALVADERKGVRSALAVAKRRLQAEADEEARLASMYSFERSLCGENPHAVVVGLDEVGRGPLAGPLAVGAVVLPAGPKIAGLNDSKQVKPADRERIAAEVKRVALAWDVHYIEPSYIDDHGMTASLRLAFASAVKAIERAGVRPDVILLDGNPLHLDPREVNVRRSRRLPLWRRSRGTRSCAAMRRAIPSITLPRTRGMQAKPTLTLSSVWV